MTENKQLQKLTEAIELLVNKTIAPIPAIPPIPAIAPIPAIPPLPNYTADHDLLQKLDVKVDLIQSDITELKKQNTVYVNQTEHNEVVKIQIDHEQRIRNLETSNTRILTWGSMAIVAVGILETLLTIYFKR